MKFLHQIRSIMLAAGVLLPVSNYLRTLQLDIAHNDEAKERIFEGHVQSR